MQEEFEEWTEVDEPLHVSESDEPHEAPRGTREGKGTKRARESNKNKKTKKKKKSSKVRNTETLLELERNLERKQPDLVGNDHEPEPVEERRPGLALTLGCWTSGAGTNALEVQERLRTERGLDPVWDTDQLDFEGVTIEMLSSVDGLRCGVAARRPALEIELKPCMPRSLGSEVALLFCSLDSALYDWLSRRLLRCLTKWKKLETLHVACVRTAVSCLVARVESQGFRALSLFVEELPGFRKHEEILEAHQHCKLLPAKDLRKRSIVRLVASQRRVFVSISLS